MTKSKNDIIEAGLLENFDRLYLKYYSRLKRFVSSYSLSEEDTEDIVQGIFVTLWEKRSAIAIQNNLSSYLLTLAKNRCIDYFRHKITVNQFIEESKLKIEALSQIKDYDLSDEELERILLSAVDQLPPRCREIFMMSRFEGLKYREIAYRLDISESTVENQMGIALQRLRRCLKDYLPILVLFL